MRGTASRPWSSEGRGFRNTSPGFHSFQRGANAGFAGRSGAGRVGSRAAVADGNWHSFGGRASAARTHASVTTAAFNRGFVGNGAWRGAGWRGGWGGRGGFGWGWGCCSWGLGWGWGGYGWGLGWDPFWAWPGYWYNPWLYGYSYDPEYIYPNP
jgi:hypothetical protein